MSNKFVDKPGLDRRSVPVKGHSNVRQKKHEFIRSFFERIVGMKKTFLRLYPTFNLILFWETDVTFSQYAFTIIEFLNWKKDFKQ